jgi:uncharacterized membrane protein
MTLMVLGKAVMVLAAAVLAVTQFTVRHQSLAAAALAFWGKVPVVCGLVVVAVVVAMV